MKMPMSNKCLLIILISSFSVLTQVYSDKVTCFFVRSPCFRKQMKCPSQCPSKSPPLNSKEKVCYINCNSPVCQPECKNRKPNCHGQGAACLDPRFIGGDGIVFYFHGKSNEHFTLVSDPNLQINARFIGLRPMGRSRDYTWIQAIGVLSGSDKISIEATPAETWSDKIDHLKFTYNEENLDIQESNPLWISEQKDTQIERTSRKNSAIITIANLVEISVNVVPITKEDDRIHNYQIPANDCFAHLEVQFRFLSLSSKVEGVLGRTYQPDFQNPAKAGVAMAVVGGENKYRTSSLLSADCESCSFSPNNFADDKMIMEYSTLDCTGGAASGNGIVCRK